MSGMDHGSTGLRTLVSFERVAVSGDGHARALMIGEPTHTLSAEEIFEGLLTKIVTKGGKRQADRGVSNTRGLLVDCGRTGLDVQMRLGRPSFDHLAESLPFDDLATDFLAFTLPKQGRDGPTRGLCVPKVMYETDRISSDQIALLFDVAASTDE